MRIPAVRQTPCGCDTNLRPRERLLVIARDLFYRYGIHAVGVDAIAEAAGTNKMTLYRHFASKDLLIAECLRGLAKELNDAWDTIAAAHADDPKGQFVAWLDYYADLIVKEAERGCALVNAAIELPDRQHPARQVVMEIKTAKYAQLLALCRRAGVADPELLADEIDLLLEGARVSIQSAGSTGPAARLGTMLQKLIADHLP